MWKITLCLPLLLTAFLPVYCEKNIPLDLIQNEQNASAQKLQHWYKHQCWRAIENYYQAHKTQMTPEESNASLPIIALSYSAQGNQTAAEALANAYINNNKSASPHQLNIMHGILLKSFIEHNDWTAAEPHYRTLLKSDNVSSLPLWIRYTLADTALQQNDPSRTLTLLTSSYASTDQNNPLRPRMAFLLAIANMRLKNPEQAHAYFTECYEHPEAGTLAGLAAKGRVQATNDRLKSVSDEKKPHVERQLLTDLQALLDDHTSLTEAEKSNALRQQAQLLSQMLRHEEANERLNQILHMSSSPQERAQIYLQIAFNSYLARKDANSFHYNAQQALRTDPALASLKSLRLALFHIYEKLSDENPQWTLPAAEQLAAAYPSLNSKMASPHLTSARNLSNKLYQPLSTSTSSQLGLLLLPPQDTAKASTAAHLLANLGSIESSLTLYASIGDIKNIEALSDNINSQDLREKQNAILAYLYARNGSHPEACAKAALALTSSDKQTVALATLAYAAAGWRTLAAQNDPNPDNYIHLLELLSQLQENRQAESEPWHVEAALEYALASAYLLRNDPKSAEQNVLLLDRIYAKYFDHEGIDGQVYWKSVREQPNLQRIMERYAALFNAKSAEKHAELAQKNGNADEVLAWNRKAEHFYRAAQGQGYGATKFLLDESKR